MKNLKKTLAMISSVVMAGSMFAACGNDTTPATDSAADTTTAAADAAADDTAAADDAAARRVVLCAEL